MAADGGPARTSAVAVLYELWTLEVVIDLGVVCGSVVSGGAQQFKGLSATTADDVALLQFRTGYDERHLDATQRSGLCTPLLGASDGTRHEDTTAAFHQGATALRQAAADFVQRSFDTGEQQLRNAFRDASRSFGAYLDGVDGAVVESAARRLDSHLDEVVTVLRDRQFSGGLGLPPAPAAPWPRLGELSGDGAALVRALDHQGSDGGLTTRPPVDEAEFLTIQRIADQGAAAIDAVLADPGFPDDGDADTAINGVYRWWTALRDYRGTA